MKLVSLWADLAAGDRFGKRAKSYTSGCTDMAIGQITQKHISMKDGYDI